MGIGPDGISQKLDRLLDALNYRLTRCTSADSTHFGIQKAIHCLGQWQKCLRKKRAAKRHARLEERSEARLTAGEVDEAVEGKAMWSHYRKVVRGVEGHGLVTPKQLELTMGAVMYMVMARSTSRPGAVANFTLGELGRGKVQQNGCTVYSVKDHKTGTMGTAQLTLDGKDATTLRQYVTVIRPELLGSNDSDLVFVRPGGRPIVKPRALQEALSKAFGVALPSATQIRMAIASEASETLGAADRRAVSRRMAHSSITHERYYEANVGASNAARAHELVKQMGRKRDASPPVTPPSLDPSPTKKAKRHKFPEGLQQAIEIEFGQEIQSNTAPGMAKCRAFVEKEGCTKSPKDICDKVRTLVRKRLGQKR